MRDAGDVLREYRGARRDARRAEYEARLDAEQALAEDGDGADAYTDSDGVLRLSIRSRPRGHWLDRDGFVRALVRVVFRDGRHRGTRGVR